MKRRNKSDILEALSAFKKIMEKKPSPGKMMEEVQMMGFKVRPLRGDIGAFNSKNTSLVETLWSLGKLDELFKKKKLSAEVFNEINQSLQAKLNLLRPVNQPTKSKDGGGILEIEILKEGPTDKVN